MQSEPVQDPKGNIIATIETDERGHAVLRRSEVEIVGYYEPDPISRAISISISSQKAIGCAR
jgi:hypothetical protein